MAEGVDGLGDAVFVDVEGVLAEIEDGTAAAVEDGGVEADLVGVFAEGELAAVALLGGSRGWSGRGGLRGGGWGLGVG